MSGICGWFSHEPDVLPIAAMAAPFGRDLPLHSIAHGMGAMAAVARPGEISLVQDDGLAIVCHGGQAAQLAGLWRRHGPAACAALSGEFSFALFDASCGEALVAVDRCATRPLLYQAVGRALLFASTAEALARHPGAGREVDPQALFDYLYLDGASGPRPLLAGQRRLAPGECLHLRRGRVERSRYWRMRYAEHVQIAAPETALLDALSSSLAGAAARRHGPDAAGLLFTASPGSMLLAAALATPPRHARQEALHTYTVGFLDKGQRGLNRARAAAGRLGTLHREQLLGPEDVAGAVGVLACASDGPCGDPDAVAMLFGARMAREDGLQHLHGAHGDAELLGLGGKALLARPGRYERLPGALRQLLIEPLLFGLGGRIGGAAGGLRERIEHSLAAVPERLRRGNRMLLEGPAAVFDPAWLDAIDPQAPACVQEEAWWAAPARSPVNRAIDLQLHGDLPFRVLPAFAAACAVAGVQPLLPYLDDAVLTACGRLAPRHKGEGGARRLLARALRASGAGRGALARGPVEQTALPLGAWLLGDTPLRTLAGDSLSDLGRRRIVRRDFLDLLLARRLPEDPQRYGRMVWHLMMLEQWLARRERAGEHVQARRTSVLAEPA